MTNKVISNNERKGLMFSVGVIMAFAASTLAFGIPQTFFGLGVFLMWGAMQ